MASILSNTEGGLITADRCALVLIDYQPLMAFGVGSGIDRQMSVSS